MLIEIDKLCVSIGGVPILRDVRLSLAAGEIYGLIGPNGAGKTTTIAVALGLLTPDAGHVCVLGSDPLVAAHENYSRLGVLPEENGFYGWMSGEQYLGFFAQLRGLELAQHQIERRLRTVGLEPRPQQAIATYSRGMRQRLGLARALLGNPKLLILDEPTNGLDPRGRREIHDILIDRSTSGVGILLCTHLLEDVDRLCHRVGIIAEGRTIAEGAVADLIRNEKKLPRYRLRLAGEPPSSQDASPQVAIVAHEGEWWIVDLSAGVLADAAWRELMFRGWPIMEIRREGGGLEDLYLTLTERRAA